jgi:hypothetical protein
VSLPNDPGACAAVARMLAGANVNVEYFYGTAVEGHELATVVVGVADPQRAASAAGLSLGSGGLRPRGPPDALTRGGPAIPAPFARAHSWGSFADRSGGLCPRGPPDALTRGGPAVRAFGSRLPAGGTFLAGFRLLARDGPVPRCPPCSDGSGHADG